MINSVTLVGRTTKAPELRFTPNGAPVCTFTVAVQSSFKNQNGEFDTDFINVVTWHKQAENVANYVKKGHMVGVQGALKTRNYQHEKGHTVYVTEVLASRVQFLEQKKEVADKQSEGQSA